MATITKRIQVCDVCREVDKPIVRFRIAVGHGRLRTYELCDDDAAPMQSILTVLGAKASLAPTRRVGKQVSMDELAAIKASAPTISPEKAPRTQRSAPEAQSAKGAGSVFLEAR